MKHLSFTTSAVPNPKRHWLHRLQKKTFHHPLPLVWTCICTGYFSKGQTLMTSLFLTIMGNKQYFEMDLHPWQSTDRATTGPLCSSIGCHLPSKFSSHLTAFHMYTGKWRESGSRQNSLEGGTIGCKIGTWSWPAASNMVHQFNLSVLKLSHFNIVRTSSPFLFNFFLHVLKQWAGHGKH